jgi:hypothetical protein
MKDSFETLTECIRAIKTTKDALEAGKRILAIEGIPNDTKTYLQKLWDTHVDPLACHDRCLDVRAHLFV